MPHAAREIEVLVDVQGRAGEHAEGVGDLLGDGVGRAEQAPVTVPVRPTRLVERLVLRRRRIVDDVLLSGRGEHARALAVDVDVRG
jgi:hypothetical protein